MKWIRTAPALELPAPPAYRYGLFPFFALAVLFIILAPTYWNEVQVRSGTVGEAYENTDLYDYVYPVNHYLFERAHLGSLPLWNARQLCGTPLLADPRVGLFQPLTAIFLLLPTDDAMAVHAFAALFLMGLFFALFARALGVSYSAAALGGMAYAFSGLAAACVTRPPLAAALTWTPFLLWAVREYAHRFDTASAVLGGVGGALLITSGAGGFAVVMSVVAGFYALQSIFFAERGVATFGTRARGLAIMLGVSIGASAAQWLPTLFWMRTLEAPSAILWGMPVAATAPDDLRELIAHIFTSAPGALPRIAYVGVLPLLFAPVALLHRQRRRDAAYFLLTIVIFCALIVLFGWRMPFGFPLSALLLPVVFSILVLATIGADRVFIPKRTFRSPSIWLHVLLLMLISALLFVLFGAEIRRYVIPAAAITLLYGFTRLRGLAPLCFLLLGILLIVDLTTANRTVYRHPRQDAPACYETYQLATTLAREQSLGGRVVVSARELDHGLTGNLGMIGQMNCIGGAYLPLTPDQSAWWDRLAGPSQVPLRATGKDITPDSQQPSLLRYTGARVVIAAPQGALYGGAWKGNRPEMRELSVNGDVRLFALDDALPRAYWAPHAQVEVGMSATLDALGKPDFDPTQSCVVDALSPGIGLLANSVRDAAKSGTAPTEATCSVEDLSPEKVVVRVDAPRDGITVLSDTYASGWTATLDGKRAPMLKVNGLFRGIATPAGAHEIRFTYRPLSVYVGLAISCLTLLAALIGSVSALAKSG